MPPAMMPVVSVPGHTFIYRYKSTYNGSYLLYSAQFDYNSEEPYIELNTNDIIYYLRRCAFDASA